MAVLRGQPRWELKKWEGFYIWVLPRLHHSIREVWFSDLGLAASQIHPPEAITTKFDFLLCEYLFIMKMLLE